MLMPVANEILKLSKYVQISTVTLLLEVSIFSFFYWLNHIK